MSLHINPSNYQTICNVRFLCQKVENLNQIILNNHIFSIYQLLQKFYLTDEEKKSFLKNKGFFSKLHFYTIGHTQRVNEKIERQIRFQAPFERVMQSELKKLNSPENILQNVTCLFDEQRKIYSHLKSVNISSKILTTTFSLFVTFWLIYNIKSFTHDLNQYCYESSEIFEVNQEFLKNCPTQNTPQYFYELNKGFFALPTVFVITYLVDKLKGHIFSRYITNPLKTTKECAAKSVQQISQIREFLLSNLLDTSRYKQ